MRPIPTAQCLSLIHQFEGNEGAFEPIRSLDPTGNWEIGWSHKLSGESDPLWNQTLSAAQANSLAIADLTTTAIAVTNALPNINMLSDNQYAALIDFTYNEGVGAFRGSTLCQCAQNNDIVGAKAQFGRWIFGTVNGQKVVLPGLVTRRNAEAALWVQ